MLTNLTKIYVGQNVETKEESVISVELMDIVVGKGIQIVQLMLLPLHITGIIHALNAKVEVGVP